MRHREGPCLEEGLAVGLGSMAQSLIPFGGPDAATANCGGWSHSGG